MATGIFPFKLVYSHEAILPMELTVALLKRQVHSKLSPLDYTRIMLQELDELDEERLLTYDRIKVQKRRVEWAYNKKVKYMYFKEGDLVWKLVLSIGYKDRSLGK